MDYKKLCENFAPLVYKKHKKQWGARGSSLIDSPTEAEAYELYYAYLKNQGLIK